MGKDHRGPPPGSNKKEGSGLKPVMSAENLERNEETTEKCTKDQGHLSENVEEMHSNRNPNKDDSADADGCDR